MNFAASSINLDTVSLATLARGSMSRRHAPTFPVFLMAVLQDIPLLANSSHILANASSMKLVPSFIFLPKTSFQKLRKK